MIQTFPLNLTEILTKEFVGKSYRYCIYNKPVSQPYFVLKKKQGATLKQFSDNPERFGYSQLREKKIGNHIMYEESKIVRVWLDSSHEEFGYNIMVELENGKTLTLILE